MFDAITYFKGLAEKNKLAKKEGYHAVTISGPGNLEGIFEHYRDYDRLIAVTDTTTGNISSRDGAFNFQNRRAYTVFILSAYEHNNMEKREEQLDICRTLFRQFVRRILRDKYQYKNEGTFFDTQSIPYQELGRYFLSGMTGLHFTLYMHDPVSLEYIEEEWDEQT